MNDQTQAVPAAPVKPQVFSIANGIAIPARAVPNAGPRESKYPIDQLQPGGAFAVEVKDEKEARQKQSQFSSLARSRKVSLITRIIKTDAENPGFEGVKAPFIAVWHNGEAKPKAPKAPKADAGGNTATDAGASASGTEAPAAAPAPAAVVSL